MRLRALGKVGNSDKPSRETKAPIGFGGFWQDWSLALSNPVSAANCSCRNIHREPFKQNQRVDSHLKERNLKKNYELQHCVSFSRSAFD